MARERRKTSRSEMASDETKRRILAAARDQLNSKPFAQFSVEAIARRAGVTRLTVYYQFGSKRGLLEALYDSLAEKGALNRLGEVFGLSDPAEALVEFVGAFCRFWSSETTLIRTLRSLAALDPEFQPAIERDRWRRLGLATVVQRLDSAGRIMSLSPRDELIDVLASLTSFELFDALAKQGHLPEDVARLIRGLCLQAIGLPT